MSLYEETLEALKENNKTFKDVLWIGGEDFEISKENFIELAKISEYDNGYGYQMVAEDLVVVGNDWWLERGEYDGSEWWDFKTMPSRPNNIQKISALGGGRWKNLKEIQEIY